MLRIIRVDRSGAPPTIRLEGKLFAPWVDEVKAACRSASLSSSPVALDLSMVTFIDQTGIDLLRSLISGGIQIKNCTNFVTELLKGKDNQCL